MIMMMMESWNSSQIVPGFNRLRRFTDFLFLRFKNLRWDVQNFHWFRLQCSSYLSLIICLFEWVRTASQFLTHLNKVCWGCLIISLDVITKNTYFLALLILHELYNHFKKFNFNCWIGCITISHHDKTGINVPV